MYKPNNIQLRWLLKSIEKPVSYDEFGIVTLVQVNTEKFLQYRIINAAIIHNDNAAIEHWSEWQDVPVESEN